MCVFVCVCVCVCVCVFVCSELYQHTTVELQLKHSTTELKLRNSLWTAQQYYILHTDTQALKVLKSIHYMYIYTHRDS